MVLNPSCSKDEEVDKLLGSSYSGRVYRAFNPEDV